MAKNDIIYKIQLQEWKFLMVCMGIEALPVLLEEDKAEQKEASVREREWIQQLYRMTKKEMVQVVDEKLQVSEPYRKLLQIVKEADAVWYLESDWGNQSQQAIVYLGNNCVWLQMDANRKECLLVEPISQKEILQRIQENEFYVSYSTPAKQEEAEYLEKIPQSGEKMFTLCEWDIMGKREKYQMEVVQEEGELFFYFGVKDVFRRLLYHHTHIQNGIKERMEQVCR